MVIVSFANDKMVVTISKSLMIGLLWWSFLAICIESCGTIQPIFIYDRHVLIYDNYVPDIPHLR